MSLFAFQAPGWANLKSEVLDARQALLRARDLAQSYYPLATQTGIHSMIEWCGVMGEYVKMLEEAAAQGLDPREVDQHGSAAVTVPDFMIQYFCEKLGCQLKPFIRGTNKAAWRRYINEWFEEGRG
jgi:hypothetical protein